MLESSKILNKVHLLFSRIFKDLAQRSCQALLKDLCKQYLLNFFKDVERFLIGVLISITGCMVQFSKIGPLSTRGSSYDTLLHALDCFTSLLWVVYHCRLCFEPVWVDPVVDLLSKFWGKERTCSLLKKLEIMASTREATNFKSYVKQCSRCTMFSTYNPNLSCSYI